jgi:hypothetical protein
MQARTGTPDRTARRVRNGSAVRASEEAGNPPYPGLSLSIGRPSLDYKVEIHPSPRSVAHGSVPRSPCKEGEGEPPLRPAVTVFPGAWDASAATASRLRAVRRISFRAAGAREDAY